jgi:hypothetical protein
MKRLNSKFIDSQHKLISSTQKKFRLYYAIMLKLIVVSNIVASKSGLS